MSEQVGQGTALPDEASMTEGQTAPSVTAGALLRHAREQAGVHVAALAVALKVPVNKIEALEVDRYDVFPDAVFMRALAASVCRTLKVDPAPVLALLPNGAPQTISVGSGLNASFKDPTGRFRAETSSLERRKPRWIGVAVGLLLIGALAVALYPRKDAGDDASVAGAASTHEGTADAQAGVNNAPVGPAPVAEASAPVESTPAGQTATAAPTAAVAPAAAAVASAPAAVDAAAAPAAIAAVDASKGVEIRAKEASWVRIVSAVNGVMLERELKAGESVVAGGAAPWSVVIGRPEVTEVFVRGQSMPMDGFGRGKVARFEVK